MIGTLFFHLSCQYKTILIRAPTQHFTLRQPNKSTVLQQILQTIRLIVSLYMVKWKTKLNSSQKKRAKLKHTSTPVQAVSWYHCNKRLWKVNTATYVDYHMRVMVQLFLSNLDVSVSWKYDYLHPSWLLKLRLYLDSTRVKSRKDMIMTIRVFTFPHFQHDCTFQIKQKKEQKRSQQLCNSLYTHIIVHAHREVCRGCTPFKRAQGLWWHLFARRGLAPVLMFI